MLLLKTEDGPLLPRVVTDDDLRRDAGPERKFSGADFLTLSVLFALFLFPRSASAAEWRGAISSKVSSIFLFSRSFLLAE